MADTGKRRIGDWIESGFLGSGSFGMVKLWQNEVTQEKIALKICRNDPPMNEKNRERWRQEVEFLNRIKHENIIQARPLPDVLACLCKESSLPALCMEYCEGGDLRKTLSTAENCCGLKETMIIRVCEDIGNAIECLHKENIVHRDLKPENIVICPNGIKNIYKVIDLGYAKQTDQAGQCHSRVGTHFYLAPEILNGQKYTLNVDLWSYGILLYECCTGFRPFPFKNFQDIYNNMSSKEHSIIAVKEEDDTLVFCDQLPEVNRLNCILQRKFEEFFRLLLDGKPTRRGFCERTNRSWRHCVDEIKNTKIIEVFCIELYKQFVYELTSDFSLQELKTLLERDTGVLVEHQELFIHDGSDLVSFCFANPNLMAFNAFMFNKAFNPNVALNYEHDLPSSLNRMLNDPERFSNRSKRPHIEVYKHSVFFIQKQMTNNKCLTRGLKALVIRLLKWSRQEFTARSEAVNKQVTELQSIVAFFKKSLNIDLKNFDNKYLTLKNGISRDLPDFEAWKQVQKEMDVQNILNEASEMARKKSELQSKIAKMKNKTPDRPNMQLQLQQWSKEFQDNYEQMKASVKKADDTTSCWKAKMNEVHQTIKMILNVVKKNNEEFYRFLRELFILRKELENFIPSLESLEMKTRELHKKVVEWQQTRQEQIWQLFSFNKDKEENVAKDAKNSQTQEKPVSRSRRRSSGAELVKQSQVLLSRMKETIKDAKDQQEMLKMQMEDLDWSFCNISDCEDTDNNIEDT